VVIATEKLGLRLQAQLQNTHFFDSGGLVATFHGGQNIF
jgi:hypothetical protein